jgi:hypothetical protein
MSDMDFTSEVVGLPIQVKESPPKFKISESPKPVGAPAAPVDTKPCPKCFKAIPVRGVTECPHCGVLVSKVKELNFVDKTPAHSQALGAAWQKVIQSYDDENTHAEFLRLAQRERNLAYAGAQYAQMQKLMADDEVTKRRIREVQALASVTVAPIDREMRPRGYGRMWQVPLVAAAMMIGVGLVFPVFRNMVGVGAAILFIAFAIQLQSRRRS